MRTERAQHFIQKGCITADVVCTKCFYSIEVANVTSEEEALERGIANHAKDYPACSADKTDFAVIITTDRRSA